MTAPKSSSEEPKFFRLPPGVHIRHPVGDDSVLLKQLAPLLEAEGLNIETLAQADPETVHEALIRAVERHNLEASTPVGDQRARTVNTLRELVTALHQENTAQVQQLFGAIGPQPTRHRPSAGHLTGVIMETLDGMYRTETLHPALQVVEIPAVDPQTKTAAQHILELAAKSDAFRLLDTLLADHGGFEIARAGLNLLVATTTAVAQHQQVTFDEVLNELLPELPVRQPVAGDPNQPPSPSEYLTDFTSWLTTQDDVDPAVVPKIVVIFESMVHDAQTEQLNPHDPQDFDVWIMAILATTQPEYVVTALDIVQHYVRFRLRTDLDPTRWEAAHKKISDMTVVQQKPPWDFEKIFATAQQVDPAVRLQAAGETPIIAAIPGLADWVATPQHVPAAGLPDDAQLAELGELLGLGHPATASSPPALAVPVWWWTLQALGVVRVESSRVVLGSGSQEFLGAQPVGLSAAEGFIASYVKTLFIHALDAAPLEISAVGHTLGRLLNSLTGLPPAYPASQDDFRGQLIQQRSETYVHTLVAVGFVVLEDEHLKIPDALQSAVFYGLTLAMDHMDEFLDNNLA